MAFLYVAFKSSLLGHEPEYSGERDQRHAQRRGNAVEIDRVWPMLCPSLPASGVQTSEPKLSGRKERQAEVDDRIRGVISRKIQPEQSMMTMVHVPVVLT